MEFDAAGDEVKAYRQMRQAEEYERQAARMRSRRR
jgi:hypothetical protein